MDTKLSCSPERSTFQLGKYLERKMAEGKTPDNDENVSAMVDFYKSAAERKAELEKDAEWQKNNLEWDLRSTDWILAKVRDSKVYSQNLYAALCNNSFIQNDVWPILKNDQWSCSWRYAGGIIADMREEGDYIDWYCSGITGDLPEIKDGEVDPCQGFVSESTITEEIKEDLFKLGWIPCDYEDDLT